jgi:hypothetical protein
MKINFAAWDHGPHPLTPSPLEGEGETDTRCIVMTRFIASLLSTKGKAFVTLHIARAEPWANIYFPFGESKRYMCSRKRLH